MQKVTFPFLTIPGFLVSIMVILVHYHFNKFYPISIGFSDKIQWKGSVDITQSTVRAQNANRNYIFSEERWQQAYKMDPKDGWFPLVMVLFLELDSENDSNLLGRYCILDNGKRGFARVEKLALVEDRSNHHTIIVHCFFNDRIEGDHVYFQGFRASINEKNHYDRKTKGQSLCIPSLFGKRCKDPSFPEWFNIYASYYMSKFGIKVFRIYTDDINCFEGVKHWDFLDKLEAKFEFKFVSRQNALSHLHSQRLTSFDCFYNSFIDGSEWCFVLDIDEVLQSSKLRFNEIPSNVSSLTFPSWHYNATTDEFCDGVVEMYSEDKNVTCEDVWSWIYKKRLKKSPCCFCMKGAFGRRKYALRMNYYLGGSYNGIHSPISMDTEGKILDIDSRSGFFLMHFDFQKENYDLATQRIKSLLNRDDSALLTDGGIRAC